MIFLNTTHKIAEIIELLVKNKGEHVAKVLRECNLNKDTIINMKNGREPSAKTIAKIADYFGVTTDYLLRDDEIIKNKIILSENEKELLSLFKNMTDREQIKLIVSLEYEQSAKNSAIG